MAKLKRIEDTDDGSILYVFQCPACGYLHKFRTEGPGPTWQWNEDPENPTVTPSIHVMPGSKAECHFYIEDGKIRYLEDSSHGRAGEILQLPEI